ncbi:MAG: tetratricopeptide repeat protein [Alphaproteobacteria bacterium]
MTQTDAKKQFQQGNICLAKKQYDLAITHFRAALSFSDAAAIHYKIGQCFYLKETYPMAVKAFFVASKKKPKDVFYAANLGKACLKTQDFKTAQKAFARALAVEPENPDVLYDYALATMRLWEDDKTTALYDLSVEYFKKAIQYGETDIEARSFFRLGNIYLGTAKTEAAERSYIACLERDPQHVLALVNLGKVYRDLKIYDKAEETCQKAIKIAPENFTAYYNLGNVYRDMMDWEKAVPIYQKATALNPKDKNCWLYLGESELKRFNAKEARVAYRKVLELDPEDENANLVQSRLNIMCFDFPAKREVLPPAKEKKNSRRKIIDFVIFYADIEDEVTPFKKRRYHEMLAHAVRNAKEIMPEIKVNILTDQKTELPDDLPIDKIFRYDIDTKQLMFERMRCQYKYLEETKNPIIFADCDMIFNKDIRFIFGEDFDLAFTWRDSHTFMPLNGGLIFVHNKRKTKAKKFYEACFDCLDQLEAYGTEIGEFSRGVRHWWGDQLAIAAYVGYKESLGRPSNLFKIDGIKVRLYPGDDYNYAMTAKESYTPEDLADKYVLHFKGDSKDLLEYYFAMRQ